MYSFVAPELSSENVDGRFISRAALVRKIHNLVNHGSGRSLFTAHHIHHGNNKILVIIKSKRLLAVSLIEINDRRDCIGVSYAVNRFKARFMNVVIAMSYDSRAYPKTWLFRRIEVSDKSDSCA